MRRALAMIALVLLATGAGGCGVLYDKEMDPPLVAPAGSWSGFEVVTASADNVAVPPGSGFPMALRVWPTGSTLHGRLVRLAFDNNGNPLGPNDNVAVLVTASGSDVVLLAENSSTVVYKLTQSEDAVMDMRMTGTRDYGRYQVGTALTNPVQTHDATNIVSDNAAPGNPTYSVTLHGTVNPGGILTEVWFERGTDPKLAGTVIRKSLGNVAGFALSPMDDSVSGLAGGTTYYYRAVCSNGLLGIVAGNIVSFRTP